MRVFVIAGVSHETRLACRLRVFQRTNHVAALQHIDAARVQLHSLDMISPHSPQAAVYRVAHRVICPLNAIQPIAAGVTGLCRQVELVAAVRDCLADQLLRDAVAGGSVEEVDACIQRGVQHRTGLINFRHAQLRADLCQADSQARHLKARVSELHLVHLSNLHWLDQPKSLRNFALPTRTITSNCDALLTILTPTKTICGSSRLPRREKVYPRASSTPADRGYAAYAVRDRVRPYDLRDMRACETRAVVDLRVAHYAPVHLRRAEVRISHISTR